MTAQIPLSPIVTITAKTPPHICGVGDYTINLATHLKTHSHLDLNLIVEQHCQAATAPVVILPTIEDWSPASFQTLLTQLQQANVKTVILQYTCWLYSPKGFNLDLISFWQQCAQHFQTILIAHETYYWYLKYPGTWFIGIMQQYIMRQLVRASHHICCGSELYLQQLHRFSNDSTKIHYLPIPNNIPPQPFSLQQRLDLRQTLGIKPEQRVLTLFGCQVSIYQAWLSRLDNRLKDIGYPITWLLLGDAKKIDLPLYHPIVRPDFLNSIDLSYHLQLSDLLLMPHEFGISAKRGSLMAALEHGIPVVGTNGNLTDSFFQQLSSIRLASDKDYPSYEAQVLTALDRLPELTAAIVDSQNYYHQHLSWQVVAQSLAPLLCTA